MAAAAWADANPFAATDLGGRAGGAPLSADDATEPITGGGVTLPLPLAMLDGVEALGDVLSMHTCVWRKRCVTVRVCVVACAAS
jgi:hypothetical protein